MTGLHSSSGGGPLGGFSVFGAGDDHGEQARSVWLLALAGMVAAACAASLLNLNTHWFASNPGFAMLQSLRMVVATAAMGAAAVWVLWYVVGDRQSGGVAWLARNLSACWVFLPCIVLFDQARSAWTLVFAAMVAIGFALSLRRLLPRAAEPARTPQSAALLPSLDGLPKADSHLVLSAGVALLLQASIALALGVSMLLGSLLLAAAVFLITWRWSAHEVRAAEWWGGRHPPLRQLIVAVLVTTVMLAPYTLGGRKGWGLASGMAPRKATPPKEARSSSGYFGIMLYPPPSKRAILAPMPHDDAPTVAGALAKPLVIPFDGPYWYYKDPWMQPGPKTHVAHGKPTDAGINVRSTDLSPLMMQAHQRISRPINLAACGEIDVTIVNADTRPGEIDLLLVLANASVQGHPRQVLAARQVLSSLPDPIPQGRAPVHEVLRFAVPRDSSLRQFNDLTLQFLLAPQHNRTAAKISVESFELVPRR